MIVLIAGLFLFFAVHSISIVGEGFRSQLVTKFGEGPYKGIYSAFAAVGLGLIIWGYGLARAEPVLLYVTPFWLRHVAMLLMLPVFILLIATYFPGKIKSLVKHPMLIAVKAWALAHLLTNGMLADVLLFGCFLAWAVVDRISLKKRTPREIPSLPSSKLNDVIAVVGGLILYVVFALWLHPLLIGMPIVAR